MTILFCGGEMEDFSVVGSVAADTSTATYRTAYARMALQITGSAFNVNYIKASFAASSSFSVTARAHSGSLFTAGTPFLWLSTGGSPRLRLKVNSTTPSTISLESYTSGGSATTLATSTLTIATSTLYRFDLIVNYQASGRVRLYVDQTLFFDYSGDVTASGATTLDSLSLGPMRNAAGSCEWSEVIVADEDTRPLGVKTLVPNGAGDTTQWTGAYTDVDETTASETDIISSGTAAQIINMDCTGMPSGASNLTVRLVKVVASALAGTGPGKLALGVKSGSTQSFGSDQTLTGGYASYSETFTTNPATSAAFTATELDGVKLALRSAT